YHIFENLFTYKKNMTDGNLRIDNLFFFDPLRSSKTQSKLSIFSSEELIGGKSPGWDKKSYCYKNISNFIKIYRDKINT
ncbi:MAG: hypothetical protein KAS39_07015, partial [Actinomycetia bacterium]|nr:hypothetical protein [Actinomycetes bacterium]